MRAMLACTAIGQRVLLLLVGTVLVGCSGAPARGAEGSSEPTTKESATAAAEEPMPVWNPQQPIAKLDALTHAQLYVTAKRSSICPDPESARQRSCGNSVEFSNKGYIVRAGETVTVVGERPAGDLWRAVRYQKSGLMPGWIVASDLAEKPSTKAVSKLRTELSSRPNVAEMTGSEFARLRDGTELRIDAKHPAIEFGASDDITTTLYLSLADKSVVAVEFAPLFQGDDERYMLRHDCLLYGDCLRLSYHCRPNHCDEVVIAATATGRTTSMPEDSEGEWTLARTQSVPVLSGTVLADRFGRFEARPGGSK